ncbi:hypothetical protein GWC95_08580 [Sediminibacterium roseum]|uniref:THAP4-like heme-binding beta-barrel domain-containing protein n=1 Tax=Sediminibacterium roseum TaxID=1978412 RepID=A0ABW9ZSA3_9BACT|nr:hypothetical protein [Sediminibacterium roseum]NCI49975.1 hypothetical protein [Sediminibacterium roseum]
MRAFLLLLAFFFVEHLYSQPFKTVNGNDFKQSLGAWTGTLTYVDYSTGKPFSMPANVTLVNTGNAVVFVMTYPKEPKANGNDTLHITANGSVFDGADVVSKRTMDDGTVEIVTEKNGVDGNDHRKAILRHTYLFGKNKFSTRKDVKFDGEEKWTLRNEYLFGR